MTNNFRLPVSDAAYHVYDRQGRKVHLQVNQIPQHVRNLPGIIDSDMLPSYYIKHVL